MKLSPPKLVHRVLYRKSSSNILDLIRRLKFLLNPENKPLNWIKKAQITSQSQKCEHAKNLPLEIDGRCILIPGFRNDGVGIQFMLRVCVMFLAQKANATYIHLPFLKLAHQNIDSTGCSLTPEEWAAKWEAFFNLGKDEFDIADLANSIGETTLAKYLSDKNRQFGDPHNSRREMLPTLMNEICNGELSGIYTFNLGLCRQPRECQLFLNSEFIQILQKKFNSNGYEPEEKLFNEQYLNIAIHIRRGDVWEACQSGSNREEHKNKFVSEEYYVELLQKLQKFCGSFSKPLCFHIFSDGQPDNFGKFTFTGEREAFLKLGSGSMIENIQFHLRQSTIDTLYHMIKAPIFVPGKSTFSVVAVLLSASYIFYENDILDFYQYDLLEKYIEANPRFISLIGLEDRVDDVLKTL